MLISMNTNAIIYQQIQYELRYAKSRRHQVPETCLPAHQEESKVIFIPSISIAFIYSSSHPDLTSSRSRLAASPASLITSGRLSRGTFRLFRPANSKAWLVFVNVVLLLDGLAAAPAALDITVISLAFCTLVKERNIVKAVNIPRPQ